VKDQFQGANHKHPTWDRLASISIPLPSLERQQQIVEAIDGWAGLAQQEEVGLKILEKQMMFQVKEIGHGQARVKLGNILKLVKGKRYPVGEGKDSGKYPLLRSSKDGKVKWMDDYTYEGPYITVGNGGEANFRLVEKFNASTHTLVYDVNETILKEFAYYSIQIMCDIIGEMCFQGTGLENLNTNLFMAIEIPLPPLSEQQTLQSDFDEIRHKHAKIAMYKAKAQEAIQRLIPGAA
jgi:restriction endonuclease S subunit